MYKAEIIADSKSPQGQRLTTFVVTYPRIVHAEMCRHRMHSRNTASSRAIPFEKMVKEVEENSFIPIAWQKAHKGMQGTEYFIDLEDVKSFTTKRGTQLYANKPLEVIQEEWLRARDKAVEITHNLNSIGVTKQLCNRLLEPFVWVTEIISGTEWENFFELRCPQYSWLYKDDFGNKDFFRSKKELLNSIKGYPEHEVGSHFSELQWLQLNHSQADIHIQAIAELMWDAYNESEPKELEAGEWHIPFGDTISEMRLMEEFNLPSNTDVLDEHTIKIATARCARVSYLNFEGKDDYEADIKLHDRLMNMKHFSPFEHCSRAMSDEEFSHYVRGKQIKRPDERWAFERESLGWCRNFRGFIQYRHLIEE